MVLKVFVCFFDQRCVAIKQVPTFPDGATDLGKVVIIDGIKCIPVSPTVIEDEEERCVLLASAEKFWHAETSLTRNSWGRVEARQANTILSSFPPELSQTVLEAL